MSNAFSKVASVLPFVLVIVSAFEEVRSGEGEDRKAAAKRAAVAALGAAEAGSGEDLLNDAKFGEAFDKLYDAFEAVKAVVESRPVKSAKADFSA